jgi:DNA-directed RNA polymerase III subunit RPC3
VQGTFCLITIKILSFRTITDFIFHSFHLQDVVQTLVKHGRQTFQELRYLSKLPTEALRTALIVLIQQNCVSVYLHTNDHDRRTEQLYEADLSRMLQILRMPRFIDFVRNEYSEEDEWGGTAVGVVQTLLHHGRLRLSQLPYALQSMDESAEVVAPRALLTAVQTLVKDHLIERVPPCTLPPPAMIVHPAHKKKKNSAPPKAGTEEEAQFQREQAKEKERQDFQSVRFSLRSDEANLQTFEMPPKEEDTVDEAGAGPSSKKKRAPAAAPAPPPAKRGKLVAVKHEDGSTLQNIFNINNHNHGAVTLWRVNYDEFNRRFRNQEIVKSAQDQFDAPTQRVLKAVLAAAAAKEAKESVHDPVSAAVTVDEVLKRLKQPVQQQQAADGEALPPVTRDSTYKALNALFLGDYISDPHEHEFVVKLQFLLGMIRQTQILAVIGHRFGETARRIWYMLHIEKQLEQKVIAEKAMVPNAEAREALYAMLKDGYVGLQDIPRNNDRAPSKTFYTWRAALGAASTRLATELYRSAGNLIARLQSEAAVKPELTEMIELVSSGKMDRSQLNVDAVARFKAITQVLQTSLIKLDLQMALFNDM